MKIIFDDIIYDLQKSGGISVYWRNLKKELESHIDLIIYNGLNQKRDRKLPLLISRYLNFSDQIVSPHLFHSSYYRISKNRYTKNIITIHDFVYEYFSTGIKKKIHVLQKKNAILNADRIICISENTKNDLLKFYPSLDEKIIKVIYHGVSKEFFKIVRDEPTLEKNNLIFVGKRNGYKNFQVLINYLSNNVDYNLTLVGGGSLSKKEKNALKNINYKHYQNISNSELNNLYNNSFALIYPSLYEGFGLPIIEALKAGCPVICNDGSSTKEIGDQYVLKGNISADFINKSLKRLEDLRFRKKIISDGIEYASTFTWEKTAQKTLELYKELWEEFQ